MKKCLGSNAQDLKILSRNGILKYIWYMPKGGQQVAELSRIKSEINRQEDDIMKSHFFGRVLDIEIDKKDKT